MNKDNKQWLQDLFQKGDSITFDSREDANKAHWMLIELDVPHSFGDFLIDENDTQTFKAGITLNDREAFEEAAKTTTQKEQEDETTTAKKRKRRKN